MINLTTNHENKCAHPLGVCEPRLKINVHLLNLVNPRVQYAKKTADFLKTSN